LPAAAVEYHCDYYTSVVVGDGMPGSATIIPFAGGGDTVCTLTFVCPGDPCTVDAVMSIEAVGVIAATATLRMPNGQVNTSTCGPTVRPPPLGAPCITHDEIAVSGPGFSGAWSFECRVGGVAAVGVAGDCQAFVT
jgi:hypothetical protein